MFIALILICNIYEPYTYSFSNYSIGNGRFDDFFNIFNYASIFPNNGSYCITPWQIGIFSIPYDQYVKNIIFLIILCLSIYLCAKIVDGDRDNRNNLDYLWIFIYPFIFCFWRGNTELFAFCFLFYSIYLEIEKKNSLASIGFLMMACLIKPNYMIFIPLFVKFDKGYLLK